MNRERGAIIEQLLDRWEDAFEQGVEISPEELCRDHPSMLADVKDQIAILQTMNRCLKPENNKRVELDIDAKNLSDDSFRVQSKFGDFETIGSGGLGVVYRAVDFELNRDVAIKFLRETHQTEYFLKQFKQEAEITGRLDHPGVVPVYGMGRSAQGELFYTMRLVRGETLDQRVKEFHGSNTFENEGERWLAMRDLLQRFVSVCKTIAYAHTRGILHRDIKPHNVMLGKYGETLVVDWGLAIPFQREAKHRVVDEKTLLPRTSDGIAVPDGHGTPAYMSPEQAAGTQQLDATSDIFALGSTLYKILTGEIPFPGRNSVEVKRRIMDGKFTPPHLIDSRVSKVLSAICCKALAHRPTDRYHTAMELAMDIERYLANEPVSVYRESFSRRVARWAQRNRVLAQLGTVLLVAALLGVISLWFIQTLTVIEQARIREQLNVSLQQSLEARRNGATLTTTLIARSIEFDLQNRFSRLEQVGKLIEYYSAAARTGGILGVPQKSLLITDDEWHSILEQSRFEADCVAPSIAWFVVDEKLQPIVVSLDEDSDMLVGSAMQALRGNLSDGSGDESLDFSSSLAVPQIAEFVADDNLANSFVVMLSPLQVAQNQIPNTNDDQPDASEENSHTHHARAVGMIFRTAAFAKLADVEMERSSIKKIHLVNHFAPDLLNEFFRDPLSSTNDPATESDSEELADASESIRRVLERVDLEQPLLIGDELENFSAVVPLSIKNGQLTPVKRRWLLLIDFK
ncbi:MAG TPA: serine/threonine-protein kinase [Pirellulaceae bacterium]|nr:serine/threonine-protein kinase [Pirellulaceae bacterium]HMO91706.1 serine/threonine-protein kinase [Pirellulaceae bacterium]HMP68402.1 serine/threonine-protein kinase [Pirellulaceae bacterium]